MMNSGNAAASPAATASGGLMRLLDRAESTEPAAVQAATAMQQASASVQPTRPQLALMDQVARAESESGAQVPAETKSASAFVEQSHSATAAPVETSQVKEPAVEQASEQEAAGMAPSSVANAVAALAQAHYQAALPAEGEKPMPQKRRGRPPMRRPASAAAKGSLPKKSEARAALPKSVSSAAKTKVAKSVSLKKPAAKSGRKVTLPSSSGMKKPAASAKVKACKKSFGSGKRSQGHHGSGKIKITPAERVKLRPNGCSGCRYTRSCCPSCWTKRGYELI